MTRMVRRQHLGVVAAAWGGLVTANCGEWIGQSPMPEYEEKHIVVDDSTIDKVGKWDVGEVIKPVSCSVEIYDGETEYYTSLKGFSLEQRYVYAIFECYDMEVNNGGHAQFYSNYTGIVWEEALNGLRAIGALEHYELMKESVKRMGGKPSKDWEKRNEQLYHDGGIINFDDIDERFYDIRVTGALDDVLTAFVRRNREKFYFDGIVIISSL